MSLNFQMIALQVAEKLREIATRPSFTPFKSGDLRKSHVVQPQGKDDAILTSNMPYARRVHDGSGEVIIRPKRKKALRFQGPNGPVFARKVVQPKREGNPWLIRAIGQLQHEGLDFLAPQFGDEIANELTDRLRSRGLEVTQKRKL